MVHNIEILVSSRSKGNAKFFVACFCVRYWKAKPAVSRLSKEYHAVCVFINVVEFNSLFVMELKHLFLIPTICYTLCTKLVLNVVGRCIIKGTPP
jgi:hypothetical protein